MRACHAMREKQRFMICGNWTQGLLVTIMAMDGEVKALEHQHRASGTRGSSSRGINVDEFATSYITLLGFIYIWATSLPQE